MQIKNEIQIELKALQSTLAGLIIPASYSVPDGYFDEFSFNVLSIVHPNLKVQDDENKIPDGYFDSLAGNILQRIKNEPNQSLQVTDNILSPALFNKINTYQVPIGYFESLPAVISNKINQVENITPVIRGSFILRYALAAVLTGLLGLSLFSVFNTSDLPKQPERVMAQAKTIIKTNSFNEVLATLSDTEIVDYLQENGQDVNAALVASVTDSKNLPDQLDYLMDDKTLINLLNELNIPRTANN